MKWYNLAGLALSAIGPAMTAAIAAPPPRPKLIVMISVDQFSADLFAEYRARFTGGLRRMQDGVVFPSGYQSHAATETCPGHSTILTGSHPSRTGIVANSWFDLSLPRPDKKVYCSEDPTVAGSSSANYTPSVQYLRVPTLGDRMKRADPQARVVSVAGKDRAALMMGGHDTDQVWFWADDRYRTLDDRKDRPVPAAVTAANARTAAALARPAAFALPRQCAGRDRAIAAGTASVGIGTARAAGDRRGWRASPAFDDATTDLAIAMLDEQRLGQGPSTDLLIVGLSGTDYAGHSYGTEGAEMCAQMAALDADLGRLLKALDGRRIPYLVGLTADHGGHDLPERNVIRDVGDAVRVDPALLPGAMDKAIRAEFGFGFQTVYGDGPFGDLYVAREVPAALRPRIVAALKARYLANRQVEAVFTHDDLMRPGTASRPVDEWSLIDRARASFDPARSGDLVVLLKPHVVPIVDPGRGYVATHGSAWNYDRRVPMLFWWPGVAGYEQPVPVETVDILPTLAATIGLSVPPAEIDGRCLDLDIDAGTTCPRPPVPDETTVASVSVRH